MRVILDTNVFISGVFFSGPPCRILEAWRDSKLKLLISQEILYEYQRAGAALAAQFPLIDLGQIIELVINKTEMWHSPSLPNPVCVVDRSEYDGISQSFV